MRVVVADTSPINYLVLIDRINLLRDLYCQIVIPVEVFHELKAEGAPAPVAAWIQSQPDWVDVRSVSSSAAITADELGIGLDAGETAAIQLALAEAGSLLLIDEALGRSAATRLGLDNTGTLGVLVDAAVAGFVDLGSSLEKLRSTNFRIKQSLIENLLAVHQQPRTS